MRHTHLERAVSVLFYIDAFMWLVGVVPTLYYAFIQGALPTMFGIRLMSGLSSRSASKPSWSRGSFTSL